MVTVSETVMVLGVVLVRVTMTMRVLVSEMMLMRVIGMVSEILIDMAPMMVSGRRWRWR